MREAISSISGFSAFMLQFPVFFQVFVKGIVKLLAGRRFCKQGSLSSAKLLLVSMVSEIYYSFCLTCCNFILF